MQRIEAKQEAAGMEAWHIEEAGGKAGGSFSV